MNKRLFVRDKELSVGRARLRKQSTFLHPLHSWHISPFVSPHCLEWMDSFRLEGFKTCLGDCSRSFYHSSTLWINIDLQSSSQMDLNSNSMPIKTSNTISPPRLVFERENFLTGYTMLNKLGEGRLLHCSSSNMKLRDEMRLWFVLLYSCLSSSCHWIGSYGKVHKALDLVTGEHVAIKIVSKRKVSTRCLKKFLPREVKCMSLLSHPHVVRF